MSDSYADYMYRLSPAGQRQEREEARRRRDKVTDIELIQMALAQLECERETALTIRAVEDIDRDIHHLKALAKDRS